ncbi:MAG: Spy/CpxP family protein refolding chaperone [Desulfuromonadales bacterium]
MSEKRKNMAKIAVMYCIVALAACAGIAQADDGGVGGEHCGKPKRNDFMKMGNKLGLTDDQKAQAKVIFQGNRDSLKPLIANLRTERKNLQSLIHADTIDETAIRAETARIAGIQADLNVSRAKTGAQFRAILTPSQLAILKTIPQKKDKVATSCTE